jgi:chromosome segregation ATPase
LEHELAERQSDTQTATAVHNAAIEAKGHLEQELTALRLESQDAKRQTEEVAARLRNSQETLATAHLGQQELKDEIRRLQSELEAYPAQLEEAQSRIFSLEMERDRAVAELACVGSRLREKSREIERVNSRKDARQRVTDTHQKELELAKKKVAALESRLAFYQRSFNELTPELERLEAMIVRYEDAYGPLPDTTEAG